jgi:cation transport ATPase
MKELIAIASTSAFCITIVGVIRWVLEAMVKAHNIHPISKTPKIDHFGELAYGLLVVMPVFSVLSWGFWQLFFAGHLGIETLSISQSVAAASLTTTFLFFTRVYDYTSDFWTGIGLVLLAVVTLKTFITGLDAVAGYHQLAWVDSGIIICIAAWLGMLVFTIVDKENRPFAWPGAVRR